MYCCHGSRLVVVDPVIANPEHVETRLTAEAMPYVLEVFPATVVGQIDIAFFPGLASEAERVETGMHQHVGTPSAGHLFMSRQTLKPGQ